MCKILQGYKSSELKLSVGLVNKTKPDSDKSWNLENPNNHCVLLGVKHYVHKPHVELSDHTFVLHYILSILTTSGYYVEKNEQSLSNVAYADAPKQQKLIFIHYKHEYMR